MTTLTLEQVQAIERAGDLPVEMIDPKTNISYVLVKAEVYARLREIMDEALDRDEQDALLAMSRKNRLAWLAENPY